MEGGSVMINLTAIFISNGLAVMLMILLLFSHRRRSRNLFYDDKLFSWMCMLTLFLSICETVVFCIDGVVFTGAIALSRVLNAFIFMSNAVFSFSWVVYIYYKLFGNLDRLKQKIWVAIPGVIIFLMAFFNVFFDIFFTISNDNVYVRTPLAYLNYLVTYGYLSYGSCLVIIYRQKIKRYMFMPVVLFMFPIFIGSLIQMFCYGIALIWVSVALGLTSLYLNLQNEATLMDPLTQLYNREYLLRYLSECIAKHNDYKALCGMMIDINSFKYINDTFGHLEGDFVIEAVGSVLLKQVGKNGIASRYGGDEFIIVKYFDNEAEIEHFKNNIVEAMKNFNDQHSLEYEVNLSIGIGIYEKSMQSVDDFLKCIDKKMYEEKSRYYSTRLHDRRH